MERDPEVIVLQKRLRETGFYSGEIDGDFGPKTLAAALKALEGMKIVVTEPAPEVAPLESHEAFFDEVRDDLGVLTQSQVEGFNTFFKIWNEAKLADLRWFAYMLATAWHETGRAMKPVIEMGGVKYLKSKKYYPYYGRGYVQLTWKANYERYGIAAKPDRALEPELAAHIMIDGMTKGTYTGKGLNDYFNGKKEDPINARRIINGTDRAKDIADYYKTFLAALKAVPTKVSA